MTSVGSPPPAPAARAAPAPALRDAAHAVRVLAMDAVQQANSGHPGMPMGMADAAAVLWARFLKFDPADPAWPDRDRFGASAPYQTLYRELGITPEAVVAAAVRTLGAARS